jgi:DNA topoisomerase-3
LEHLSEPELFLYDLIRRRYLAQFFPAHEYDQTVIELDCQGYKFRASGRVDRVAGWKTAYQEPETDTGAEDKKAGAGHEEAQALPQLSAGDTVLAQDLVSLTRQTKPPAPYTEGTLIQAMKGIAKLVENPKLKAILRENAGIGTEATRANIIETLLHRKLLERVGKKKQLRATPKGAALIAMLPDAVKDPALTAAWEQALESIASGEMTLMQFMDKQQNWLLKVLERAKSGVNIPVQPESVAVTGGADAATMTTRGNASSQQAGAAAQDADGKACPVCGKPMLKRNGKYGDFWGCSGFPGCKTIVKVDGA